ncbi:hypothetical protein OG874_37670 [Nocardia sp. NBC_00565]|uniref:hypothetical protein n=1 Tax=Nocardia sp. NBC_00565 TaxID=2975993 RepID=UPI002E7FE008|nr:hypothetical protein [Nocardia sp. NBC_00565]WUC02396.1 hypothetical protein OG874_37670 [Nocardia sp. NBC_00565]
MRRVQTLRRFRDLLDDRLNGSRGELAADLRAAGRVDVRDHSTVIYWPGLRFAESADIEE